MPRQKKIQGYAEKNYDRSRNVYDSIYQIFTEMKDEAHGHHSWNRPTEQLEGCTMRFVGDGMLEITHHTIETTTVEGIARDAGNGAKFLTEIEKELKKRYKKACKRDLGLKKIKENAASPELMSRINADTSWMLGSSRYGYGNRPVGRFLIRTSRVYEFETEV